MNRTQARRFVGGLARSAHWGSSKTENYIDSLVAGNITTAQLRQMASADAQERANNRARIGLISRNLGIPKELVDSFIDSYIKYDDPTLAIAEVRESPTYDTYFPGNRREDGTLRYSEQQYLQVVESYAATLEDYGVNPDVYEEKFGELIAGDVAPDEFYNRVDAINQRIIQQPPELREAFANEFGLPEASDPAAILGIALAPDIGEQVRERRLSIAQVTGQAKRYGFGRSRQRVENLLNAGLNAQQAGEFYSGAVPTVSRLAGSAGRTGEQFGIDDLEDAVIGGDTDAMATASRLSAQESSRYSRSVDVTADRDGALTGLTER